MIGLADDGKESKTLKYLQMIDGLDKVITMIINIREAKGESIMIRRFTKEVQNDNPVKISKLQPITVPAIPQQLIMSLKTVP